MDEDRREHLLAINHSREIDCELEIACRRDGTMLALRGKIHGDMGAYIRTNGGIVPAKAAQFLHGPYRLPAIEVEVAAYMTSKTPVGTYRAPGRFEAPYGHGRHAIWASTRYYAYHSGTIAITSISTSIAGHASWLTLRNVWAGRGAFP